MIVGATSRGTGELIRAALTGLRRIYRDGYRYKKAGVMCSALVPADQVQPDLFDRQDRPKSKRLMAALDAINDRWGAGTLNYASSGLTQMVAPVNQPALR